MKNVQAYYGVLEDKNTAVIEMAQSSGLPLVEEEKAAMLATSYGTGELIKDALDNDCKRIILGLGGSATTDGGVGAFASLGAMYLDCNGSQIELNGKGLSNLCRVEIDGIDKRLLDAEIIIACDVDNPLYGPNGAAYIYSSQKGASRKEVELLDQNLIHYAAVLSKQYGTDYSNVPGSGAAGGMALPFLQFAKAKMVSGIDTVLDMIKFENVISNADIVLTGEGKIDGQSLRGKVPIGVAKQCKKQKVPVLAIVGSIGKDIDRIYKSGISAVFSTTKEAVLFDIAKQTSKEDLAFLIESLMRFKKMMN